MKPFLLDHTKLSDNRYHLNTTKYFYVSPFFDHDADFDFNLTIPGEKLNIRIDTQKNGQRSFISTLTGSAKPLNAGYLLWYAIRFPLIPLRVMFLIHWNALLLWLKKIPFHKKADQSNLQRDVFNKLQDQ
jgi:DUF1365 family protein